MACRSDVISCGVCRQALAALRIGFASPYAPSTRPRRFSHATRVAYRTAKERQPTKNAKKKEGSPTSNTETMGSPPKFNIKKVKKRKEEGSPRQKERDELLRSKEARMAAIRRANNIRRSVRNQIVAQLVATPAASPAKSSFSSPTRSPSKSP